MRNRIRLQIVLGELNASKVAKIEINTYVDLHSLSRQVKRRKVFGGEGLHKVV
ncbi:MAG: hypothetical protein ACJAW1_003331 [Glaciecola sp.]|jgi:hypothetical protein